MYTSKQKCLNNKYWHRRSPPLCGISNLNVSSGAYCHFFLYNCNSIELSPNDTVGIYCISRNSNVT